MQYNYRHKVTGQMAHADFKQPYIESWGRDSDRNTLKIAVIGPRVDVYFDGDPQGVTYSQDDFYRCFDIVIAYPHAWKNRQIGPLAYTCGD